MKISDIRFKLRRNVFKRQNSERLKEILNEIQCNLGLSRLTIKLDPREPYSPRALCFIIFQDDRPLYFGKQITMNSLPDYIDSAGMRLFNSSKLVNKSLTIASSLSSEGMTPKIILINDNILLFNFINHPTFKSLANSFNNVQALLYKMLQGLRAIHAKGVIHLDSNWENVFFTHPEALPIFIDFDRELRQDMYPVSDFTIDFFMAYAVIFVMKPFQEKCSTEDAKKLAGIYWNFLDASERQNLSLITPSHINTLFPKLKKRPTNKKHRTLHKGLVALEEVSGLSLLP